MDKKIKILTLMLLPLLVLGQTANYNTGWVAPTATGTYNNQAINPANGYANDGNNVAFPISGVYGGVWQSYEVFGIDLPDSACVTGIELQYEIHHVTVTGDETGYSFSYAPWCPSDGRYASTSGLSFLGGNSTYYSPLIRYFGHGYNKLATEWFNTDFDDSNNFRFYLRAYFFKNPNNYLDTIYMDFVKIRIWYDAGWCHEINGYRTPGEVNDMVNDTIYWINNIRR